MPERKKTVPVVTVSAEARKPLWPTGSVSCFGKLCCERRFTSCEPASSFLKKIKYEPKFFQQPNPTPDLVHREALLFVVKQEQTEFFAAELEALRAGRTVGISSPIKRLHPFIHADGTVRVRGRLQWAAIDEDEKHPILLPKESRLTKLILKHIHLKLYHAGKGPVLVEFRKMFWVTGAKTRARMTIHDCLKCARHNTRPQAPVMADLPAPRVTPSAPFTHVGIDYAGPLHVKLKNSDEGGKAYFMVFVCFATKAIHLEVTYGLGTAETLMALRRFIGRRGVPEKLYSDNGTGLMGARTFLVDFKKLFNQKWGHDTLNDYLY